MTPVIVKFPAAKPRTVLEATARFAHFVNPAVREPRQRAARSPLRWTAVTTCYLTAQHPHLGRVCAKAAVVCQAGDRYSKITGRQLALERALDDMRRQIRKVAKRG